MARWFRFYDDTINKPKVQRLPPPLFKTWVNLLCIASQNEGILPPVDELAFLLRVSASEVSKQLTALYEAELLDGEPDRYTPHNWSARQYKSDVSNERVKRHRKRSSNGERNVTSNGDVTPSETDTESDTETEQRVEAPQAPPPKPQPVVIPSTDLPAFLDRKKGTRLPPDWSPSAADYAFACEELDSAAMATREIEKFRDYWIGKSGKDATKNDWPATWRNWIRKAKEYGAKSGAQGSGNGFTTLAANRFSGAGSA